MFDMGLTELLLIGIISLLVLGPERLPSAIRTSSQKLAQLKRAFNQLKKELADEVGVDELKRDAHNSAIMKQLEDGGNEIKENLEEVRANLKDVEFDLASSNKPASPASSTNNTDSSHKTQP